MASFAPDPGSAGFATPTAMIVSLALATIAAATVLAATAGLKSAQAHLRRTQVEYALDGAQMSALLTLGSVQVARLQWRIQSPAGEIVMVAEPEATKMAPGTAADEMSSDTLRALGVSRSDVLRASLRALTDAKPSKVDVAHLDGSATWVRCARSFVSPWGRAKSDRMYRAKPLAVGDSVRGGETWRIAARLDGWLDDRTATLTGDAAEPAILREQRPLRRSEGPLSCEDLFDPPHPQTPDTP